MVVVVVMNSMFMFMALYREAENVFDEVNFHVDRILSNVYCQSVMVLLLKSRHKGSNANCPLLSRVRWWMKKG